MKLHIYSLSKTLFEGETDSVTLPSVDGEISILPHHVPLVTILKNGTVTSKNLKENKTFQIGGGIAYTDGKQLVVLAD